MTHLAMGALLGLLPGLQAVEKQPPLAAAFKAIKQEHQKAQEKFSQGYQKVKTDAERTKLFEVRQKECQDCARRALRLAREHAKDPATLEVLEWIVTGGLGFYAETWEALDLVRRDYITDPRVGKLCLFAQIYRTNYAETEKLLRAALEKNRDRTVQGYACFALAVVLKDYATWASSLREDSARAKLLEKYYPGELLNKIKASDPAKLRQEAERLFERTAKKYAEVKTPRGKRTLGERAEAALFQMHHLQVGQRAPEIEGEDIDGKKFKLSDYRGKVVLIDFWGHW